MAKVIALLWRHRPGEPHPPREANRLRAIFDEVEAQGATVVGIPFTEEEAERARTAMLSADAILTWVDPIVAGRDRQVLDSLLREASDAGVRVSAHPDVILKLGTKDVLIRTRDLEFGTDCGTFASREELLDQLPERLAQGPLVLKQYRGSSGDGVWKVSLVSLGATPNATLLEVRHALRGSANQRVSLESFAASCEPYFATFAGAGHVVAQPYQERVAEGMTRAYLSGGRVVGFGHQLVTALAPLPPGVTETPPPPPRYYYGPGQPEFQRLRHKLENGWVAALQDACGVQTDELPAIWDADFLLGTRPTTGEDSYVLCEVNVSSVFPIPAEAVLPLVAHTISAIGK